MPGGPDEDGVRDLEEPLLPAGEVPTTTNLDTPASASSADNNTNTNNNDSRKDIVLSFCCGRRRLKLNHNVFLNLLLSLCYGMSDSLWTGTVFAAYLKRLGHEENRIVGDIEAINGLAVLFSALPVGYLADRYGRDKLIRAGGLLFMATAMLHGWTLFWIGTDESDMSDKDRDRSLIALAVVMGLWGIGGGIVSGPAQALYADSTPAGERSDYYNYLFIVFLVSSCLGPIVSIFLFRFIGDEWNLFQLRTILFVGLGMEMANATIMLFFDDSKALDEGGGEEVEGQDQETTVRADNPISSGADPNAGTDDDCACCTRKKDDVVAGNGTTATDATTTTTTSSSTLDSMEHVDSVQGNGLEVPLLPMSSNSNTVMATPMTSEGEIDIVNDQASHRRWMIPYIIFATSLVFSIGSGMTVKFFPLFFKDEVGMSPSQVQVIYVLVPIFMAILSQVGTRLSKTLGRVETTVLLEGLGVSCLYSMVFFKQFLSSRPFILVPIYVMRTALMNAPYPLIESVLMDFVPKEQRARWKSLESIAQFGWCGSAAVGGYISDRWDYTATFFVTALLQTCGVALSLCFLLPLVPRSEQSLAARNSPNRDETTNNEDAQGNGTITNSISEASNPVPSGHESVGS